MAAESKNVPAENRKHVANKHDIPVTETFSVEVLHIIKEVQQQHGLRHGDYQRYRGYCSRRLRRLRKSLHFPQGNKHRVQPKKITEELLTDSRFLHILLFSAERSWAYAMQLKEEANSEPRKKFHMLARFKKAVQYAEDLNSLCESKKCDARTKLECQAYCNWLKGGLNFDMENWEKAMEYYSSAKTIYQKLSSALTEDIQVLYQQRVEELAPNLRYCAYNIGDESAMKDLIEMRLKSGENELTSKLDTLLSQTREKQAVTLSEVTWRGRSVPVKNEPVRLFLLTLQESSKQIDSAEGIDNKISIYESLLKECIDSQQVLRDALQDDPLFKAAIRGQAVDGKISNQHYLHSYLMFIRLTRTIARNLLLIETLKLNLPGQQRDEAKKITKPQDLVRLYDIIIQNLNEIPNLRGLEEDPSMNHEIETHVTGYKAFRTFFIAQSFASAKKFTEAIALYERVITYASKAIESYKKLKSTLEISRKNEQAELEELIKEVNGLKYSCHAASILGGEDITEQIGALSIKDKRPLIDRLDEYVDDASLTSKKPNLAHFPPDFLPIPCRPLFFDLALNHVQFPSLDDKLDQKKVGGLTGMVKGWLWGGKK